MKYTIYLALIFVYSITSLFAALPSEEELNFFENHVRPVLVDKCYKCHSLESGKSKGELLVDSREAMLEGGTSGPSLVPGHADKSLLIEAILYHDEDMQMPPKKKLADEDIQNLIKWVNMGAPDPRDATKLKKHQVVALEEGKAFWSFIPAKKHEVPKLSKDDWSRSNIDRFIYAKLEEKNIEPNVDAKASELLRRVSYDLTGLPPSLEDSRSFIKSYEQDPLLTFEKHIDHLLNSTAFGEKWGRHWLDLVRYADSNGSSHNVPFRNAWRYRNWVIDAMNQNMPIHQFMAKQIAGDLMPYQSQEERDNNIIATGFLMLGSKVLGLFDKQKLTMDVVDEQVDVIGKSMLALTMGCARCHDHKFDPITHKDYYALAGIFTSTQTLVSRAPSAKDDESGWSYRGLGQGSDQYLQSILKDRRHDWLIADSKVYRLQPKLEQNKSKLENEKDPDQHKKLQKEIEKDEKAYKKYKKVLASLKLPEMAMAVSEASQPQDTTLRIRGDADSHGEVVPRGFIQVASFQGQPKVNPNQSGRLELAQWLSDSRNPLTARVFVNRVWHHLFGKGIVESVDNFGFRGKHPTHPELLDYLTLRFTESKWNLKSLIKDMVMSRVYSQSTITNMASKAVDPQNQLLWKQNSRRLSAEELRDSLLVFSKELKYGPQKSSLANIPYVGLSPKNIGQWSRKRTVYQTVVRGMREDILDIFDAADANMTTGSRSNTQVAPQALYLMNSPFVRHSADQLAKDIIDQHPERSVSKVVELVFKTVLNRTPNKVEQKTCETYLRLQFEDPKVGPTLHDIGKLCQALFASTAFQFFIRDH